MTDWDITEAVVPQPANSQLYRVKASEFVGGTPTVEHMVAKAKMRHAIFLGVDYQDVSARKAGEHSDGIDVVVWL